MNMTMQRTFIQNLVKKFLGSHPLHIITCVPNEKNTTEMIENQTKEYLAVFFYKQFNC